MGGEIIKDFLTRLGFQVDEAGHQRFNKSLASATLRVTAFAAGIKLMAAGLYAGIYKIAENQRELLELSEATGVAVAKLEELDYIAAQTGSTADAMRSSIKGLQASMAGTVIGQGGLQAFQLLGIDVRDANGRLRDTSDVLDEVGRKIKGMERGRQEMFLSQLGIDKSLVPMLTSDVSDLTRAYREMYAAAGTDAQQAAEDSREFVNEIGSIRTVLGLLAKSVSMAFVGKMSGDMVRLRKGLVENFKKISGIIQIVIGVVMRLAAFFGAMAIRVMKWVGGIVDWFGRLDDGTQKIILAVLGAAAAWKFLNLSFMATPLGMIITGLIAVAALLDDFQTYMEGGESLIDWGPWADSIMAVVDALEPLMDALGQIWDMVKGPLIEGFQAWAQDTAAVIGLLMRVVAAFITYIVKLFQGDWAGALEAVTQMFQHLMDIVNVVAGRIGNFLSGAWDAVKGLFGGDDESGNGRAPLLGPTPAAVAAAGNASSATVNASTVIQVDGSSSPEATGRAVGRAQTRVNADLVRHARGAAR